jgi:hypothetical protein
VWRCGEPAESGEHERVCFRRSGEMLFGCIAIPETDSVERRHVSVCGVTPTEPLRRRRWGIEP